MLKKLPDRLRGYKQWIPADWRIVVLVDEDRQNCHALKADLEQMAHNAGFHTRSMVSAPEPFYILNRIAVEELEAWFFGDIEAIVAAYPKMERHLGKQKQYRDPDGIPGGTWEALERELQRKGYHPGGLEKLKAAEEIARHMEPTRNRSGSFQCFREGLLEIAGHKPGEEKQP